MDKSTSTIYNYLLAVCIFIGFSYIIYDQAEKLEKKDKEIARLKNENDRLFMKTVEIKFVGPDSLRNEKIFQIQRMKSLIIMHENALKKDSIAINNLNVKRKRKKFYTNF